MNVRDLQHPLLPTVTEEDKSRQRAVVSLRRLLNQKVRPQNVARYEAECAPAFAERHGRQPQSREDIQAALFEAPRYRLWSALNRGAQEIIWTTVGEPVYRDLERMRETAAALTQAPDKKGALELDPGFTPPADLASTDIHIQPGGYTLDRGPDDIVAGSLYETGGNIYSFGQGAGKSDSKAGAVLRFLAAEHPDFRPTRILDLGCSAGAASAAWAAHMPEAEVHAVDLGAGMLRYAHARAEALGVAVTFHQMDAADLRFEDESFDLVVSHNLLHEIGRDPRRAMMKEARRVCRPGGLVVHQDVPTRFESTIVHQVEKAWDTRFNGEIFWDVYGEDDLVADMRAAGFAAEEISERRLPALHGIGSWYVLSGTRPA